MLYPLFVFLNWNRPIGKCCYLFISLYFSSVCVSDWFLVVYFSYKFSGAGILV